MARDRYSESMSNVISISDSLARAMERKRQEAGFDSLDAAAEAPLADAMAADDADRSGLGCTDGELRALIAEGEARAPALACDAAAVEREVRLRLTARRPA
jgi:hypothetical protein